MYNSLMKITQPTSMAASLQMNSQHMCIEYSFWGQGVNYQMQIVTKLPNGKYPNIPTTSDQFWGRGGVNYQMQIVTKLPNGKYPNIPTTNDQFWGRGGKLPNANCDQTTKWKK